MNMKYIYINIDRYIYIYIYINIYKISFVFDSTIANIIIVTSGCFMIS